MSAITQRGLKPSLLHNIKLCSEDRAITFLTCFVIVLITKEVCCMVLFHLGETLWDEQISRAETDLGIQPFLHANILFPLAISPSLIPCTLCPSSNIHDMGHLLDSCIPHATLVTLQSSIYQCCTQKKWGSMEKRVSKMHQNVSKKCIKMFLHKSSNSGSLTHPYCHHFSTFQGLLSSLNS